VYSEGKKWGVWDTFCQDVAAGKMGFRLMKHMNRIVTQQFKTMTWWYRAHPEVFSNRSGEGCLLCPCCMEE
jgi:hypothetical protein